MQTRSALFSLFADVQGVYVETPSEQRGNLNSLIERALYRWHSFWEIMHANTASEQWEAAGMYKNSYNIWRVARLLHDKQEIVNQLRQLGCSLCGQAGGAKSVTFQCRVAWRGEGLTQNIFIARFLASNEPKPTTKHLQ